MKLYDILGRKVATITEGIFEPASYSYTIDSSKLYLLVSYKKDSFGWIKDTIGQMSTCYWYSIIDTHPTEAYCCAIDVDSRHEPHISYFRWGIDPWYAKKDGGVWFTDLPAIAYTDPNT